jgi:nucleotide-binding universal stress UspA family protein
MPRRFVVPLDGSAFAEAALPAATRMARQTGAHLELVMVHQPQLTGASPMAAMDLDARMRQHEIGYLTRQAERIATESHLAATTAVLDGPVGVEARQPRPVAKGRTRGDEHPRTDPH